MDISIFNKHPALIRDRANTRNTIFSLLFLLERIFKRRENTFSPSTEYGPRKEMMFFRSLLAFFPSLLLFGGVRIPVSISPF